MKMEDLFGLLIPVTYFVMLLIEKIWPARNFPKIKKWNIFGIFFLFLMGFIANVVPLLIPIEWVEKHSLFHLSNLGLGLGVVIGWMILSLISFFWHKNAHKSSIFWRLFHQIHHSPRRVDIPGSVLFHPFEMIVFALISVFVCVFILGLSPVTSAIVGYVQAFYGMFQHLNVNTPQIIGYLIQRPEAHCLHHEKNVHAYNYSDFPLWDILTGTFKNPKSFSGEVGFEPPVDQKIGKMLLTVDVNRI